MQKVILTQFTGEELAKYIVDEMEARSLLKSAINSEKAESDERFVGDAALAGYLGCTVQTVIALRKRHEISFYRHGRRYFYKRSEIDSALKVDARRFGELRGRSGK